jgi:hypothetical protein
MKEAVCSCPSSNTLTPVSGGEGSSELRQWPIKIRLVPEQSPMFKDADLLLIADCSAFAYSKTHEDLIKGRTIITCCPKFDTGHIEKLTNIISKNNPRSLTVVRMSVPCCSLDSVAAKAGGGKIPQRLLVVDQKGSVEEKQKG